MKAIKFELKRDLEALVLEDATTFERIGTIEKWERVFLRDQISDNLLILEVDNPRERRRVYAIQKDWIFQNANVFEMKNGKKVKEITWFDEVDKMKKFKVTVNGVKVGTLENGFKFHQGELLWQALSEQARELGINDILEEGPRLVDWGYLDDSNIFNLLKDAKDQGYISDYNVEEIEGGF